MRRFALACLMLIGAAALISTAAGAADWKRPAQGAGFAIQYQGTIAPETVAADVVDLDLFDTPDKVFRKVKEGGGYLVCYLSAGSRENWRPDAGDYPPEIVGKAYEGWPGERWVDISRLDLLGPILAARIQMAAQRGCDAIDPDNLDGYETDTGFRLTRSDAVALVRLLAKEAHRRGLAVGLKNVPELVPAVSALVDFAVTEQCAEYGFCDAYAPLLRRGRAVFNIHYGYTPARFARLCGSLDQRSTNVLKRRSLDEWVKTCPPAGADRR